MILAGSYSKSEQIVNFSLPQWLHIDWNAASFAKDVICLQRFEKIRGFKKTIAGIGIRKADDKSFVRCWNAIGRDRILIWITNRHRDLTKS